MTTTTSNGHALFDLAETRRALDLFLPAGKVTELRALEARVNGDRWAGTYTGYFAEPDKLVESLSTIKSAKGVYIIPNPVDPALSARAYNRIRKAEKGDSTSDNNIVRRHWLLIDCDDAKRPAGVSATKAEHAAALQRAKAIADDIHFNRGWPDPIIADSGNGGHLLYRIDEPADDGGLVAKCLAALAEKFTDDAVKVDTSVFNPARIWKLYGTLVCKGDNTPDRPHRMSRILSIPDTLGVVSRQQLKELASEAPAAATQETNGTPHSNGSAFDIDAFIQRHGLEVSAPVPYQGGRKWTFDRSPLCDHHDDGPHLIQFSSGALYAGCHHQSCSWKWADLRAKFELKRERATEYRDDPRKEISYQWIRSAELDSGDYSIEYAIEGAMVLGQPLTIGGPMKTLKTSILCDAAISLATAGCFLVRFPVNREYCVGVMSGESGLASIQEIARRVCRAAGKKLSQAEKVIWTPDIPKFNSFDHLEALDRDIASKGIEVLFIDPAYLAMPSADAGNLMAQGELLRNINDVCQPKGVTLVICHHTKRNTGQDADKPLELQHLAWPGHAEFARQWWLVNHRERYVPGTGEHRLWLSIGGSAGHSSLWAVDVSEGTINDAGGRRWQVSLTDPTGARDAEQERRKQSKKQDEDKQVEADSKLICEALVALPNDTGTKTDIKDATALNEKRFKPAFAQLIRDKRLVKTSIKKGNNQTYDAYTFAKDDDEN